MKFSVLFSLTLSSVGLISAVPAVEVFDCGITGFLQQAQSCNWPTFDDLVATLSSKSFLNYQNWCTGANEHNQDPTSTYTRKLTCYANINRFMRSTVQFGIVKLNLARPVRSAAASCRYSSTTPLSSLPKTVDWRSITKPVRDQGKIFKSVFCKVFNLKKSMSLILDPL